jgi:Domain of unknown function (DUF222)
MAAPKPVSISTPRPLTARLSDALATWSTSQQTVVGLAADFADSGEWAMAGVTSAAHWIAEEADIEVSTAREWIRIGRLLRSLTLIAAAFQADELSYSKVRTLTRIATPANQAQLLNIALSVPAGHLGRALSAWTHRTSSDDELARLHQEQRSVTWRTEPDGIVTFTAKLTPLVGGMLISRLSTHVMTTRTAVGTTETWPSLAQQHADALEQLLGAGSGGLTTEIVVHVRGDGTTLDDGTPLPISVVERIAPQAFIRALVHAADGRPVNASPKRRHPSTRQKRVVKERDRSCVDCGASTLLVYDHVPDYAVSRRTVVEELQLRCAPCHHHRHAAGSAA